MWGREGGGGGGGIEILVGYGRVFFVSCLYVISVPLPFHNPSPPSFSSSSSSSPPSSSSYSPFSYSWPSSVSFYLSLPPIFPSISYSPSYYLPLQIRERGPLCPSQSLTTHFPSLSPPFFFISMFFSSLTFDGLCHVRPPPLPPP